MLTPIFDVVRGESILSFSRKDGDDTDHFELRLVGDQAELSFLLTDADRRERADNGPACRSRFRLKRIAP